MYFYEKKEEGFALLIALITVSVALALGLTILEITLKQYSLSSTGRDSEMAIQAAIAGAECLEYHRVDNSSTFMTTNPSGISCFGKESLTPADSATLPSSVTWNYYEVTWNDGANDLGEPLCSKMNVYMVDARGGDETFQLDPYPSIECLNGNVCKLIVSSGYNRACSELNSIRATEREFLIY